MITGTLAATPLPEVLRRLEAEQFTGELAVHAPTGLSRIYLRQGAPVFVEPAVPGDLLGQMLVQLGRLGEAAHHQSLASPPGPGHRYGDVLLSLGLCDEAILKEGLREQVRVRLLRLYGLPDGHFAAIPGDHGRGLQGGESLGVPVPEPSELAALRDRPAPARPARQPTPRPLPAMAPRTAPAGRLPTPRSAPPTEPSRLGSEPGAKARTGTDPGRALGPGSDTRPAVRPGTDPGRAAPARSRPGTDPSRPDGLPPSRPPSDPARAAAPDLGRSAPDPRALAPRRAPGAEAPRGPVSIPPEERALLVLDVERRAKIIDKETHFSVLGLPLDASADDVRQAAVIQGKRFNPTRVAALGLSHLNEPASRIYRAIQQAYSTLSDQARREAYEIELRRLETELPYKEGQLEVGRQLAELCYARGQVYLRRRDYLAAAAELTDATLRDPSQALYLGGAAWARFCAGKQEAAEALKEVNKAVRMDPKVGRLRYFAGVLHRQCEQLDRALFCFNKAKELDPNIDEVEGEIRLLLARGVRAAKDWQSWEKEVGKKVATKGDGKGGPEAKKDGKPGGSEGKKDGKEEDPAKAAKGGLFSRLLKMEIGGKK